MTDSRGCEHEGTKVETASNRLNGVADPEGATMPVLSSSISSMESATPLGHKASTSESDVTESPEVCVRVGIESPSRCGVSPVRFASLVVTLASR